ncbi:MAG: MATE family efflux transporter, partial [Oscillospiraceae bacterium]
MAKIGKKSSVTDMTVGSPLKHIVTFAVPLMIGNMFQVFYNMADALIVGRTIGVDALAAVGAAG